MKEPKSQTESSRPRRVSQRKELAVVTLAMVASISGVGGLLAAKQYATSQSIQPVGAAEQPTVVVPGQPSSAGGSLPVSDLTSWHGEENEGIDDDGGEHAVLRPARGKPTQTGVPSWSAAPQQPAAAVSRGSRAL